MDKSKLTPFEVTGIETPAHQFAGSQNVVMRLKFADKKEADEMLLDSGVVVETDDGDAYSSDVIAVVHVGHIVDTPAEYDDQGDIVSEPTFVQGWHVDILTTEKIPTPQIEV